MNSEGDQANLSEKALKSKDIQNVISSDSSTLGLSSKNVKVDFGEIQKWRFKADQIDIENDVWVADKIIITNDPYK